MNYIDVYNRLYKTAAGPVRINGEIDGRYSLTDGSFTTTPTEVQLSDWRKRHPAGAAPIGYALGSSPIQETRPGRSVAKNDTRQQQTEGTSQPSSEPSIWDTALEGGRYNLRNVVAGTARAAADTPLGGLAAEDLERLAKELEGQNNKAKEDNPALASADIPAKLYNEAAKAVIGGPEGYIADKILDAAGIDKNTRDVVSNPLNVGSRQVGTLVRRAN